MAVSLSTLSHLGVQLQKASHSAGTGNKWLSALAVFAFTVSTWMALTVAGGTWMFYERYRHPSVASLHEMSDELRQTYVGLAAFACVFVVPAMMSLVAQSAVLGASGRERRLAALRLLGLSNRDITRLTLVETSALAFAGLVLGTVLYVIAAPAWSFVSFQNTRIGLWEILLPWWGYPALWAIILVLAAVAAVIGLKRVMVSPLGVSKRDVPTALKFWRLILFVAIVVIARVALSHIKANSQSLSQTLTVVAVIVYVIVLGINLVVPWLIQLAARISSVLPGRLNFLATRRVMTDGRTAWKRTNALTFLALLLGYVAVMPRNPGDELGDPTINRDTVTGAVVTYGVGLLVSISGTMLNQASTVFEEAELTRALDFVGVPSSLHKRVAMKQTFYPLLMTSGFTFLFGLYLGRISYGRFVENLSAGPQLTWIICAFVMSLVLSVAAVVVVDPLRQKQITQHVRRND
ncbi:FtsX-like permease family protein [Corynebacterium pseudokroppenstedtii]|uniref:FtsX-like permease family protein n=1 Tax=Corynebacterium pseudokroppenstedtii TaxID=2804917 RepID=A0AAU0Q2T5_9CORY|nr:FtsX-like permease family protein [Corynebacterium pseudokroppenstedtii]QRP14885.1 ABC transporter permease [Corynebacterium kroppenstedtii]MBY0790712.1 ABC transporter permease [Corynebacterium pseudokroppenstedtii]MCF8702464.1 ABC transporter permease [Corynebacterium pseudokroppenstedtii]MCG2635982.1 ABC transporter permease [Corynebacterium pseudokroppenstedtii]MDK7147854.1 ABC transporter permease [Corynebacterium pseudokroppenstedtii]